LQVEVRKVRTGSKRVGGVGDIDAWDGDRLILTAEAKHYLLSEDVVADLTHFAASVRNRKALGLVVAQDFSGATREKLAAEGLVTLSLAQLKEMVRLWDPLKQRIAAQAFLYYASHVESNSSLTGRIREFLNVAGAT
jgi:hypothetical protein